MAARFDNSPLMLDGLEILDFVRNEIKTRTLQSLLSNHGGVAVTNVARVAEEGDGVTLSVSLDMREAVHVRFDRLELESLHHDIFPSIIYFEATKIDEVVIPAVFVEQLYDVIREKLASALRREGDYATIRKCEDIAVNEIHSLPNRIKLVVFFCSSTGYETIRDVYIEKFATSELVYDATLNALLGSED